MVRKPNPWLAVGLSILIPGLGHFYAGSARKAAGWFLGWLGAWYGCLSWIFSEEWTNPVAGASAYVVLLSIGLGSWIDAYRVARGPARRRFSRPLAPGTALAFSILFPGLGHLFLAIRHSVRGGWWGFPAGAAALLVLFGGALEAPPLPAWPEWLAGWPPLAGALAAGGISVAAMIHSYRLGFGAGGKVPHAPRLPRFPAAVWGLAATAWLLGQAPWQAWFQARIRSFYIPSSSMEPTLRVGDRILAKRQQAFVRGEIVVFRLPAQPSGEYMVKRVIGCPGERVAIRSGRLYIDGNYLPETFLNEKSGQEFGPVEVPEGRYFLLGDARSASRDSRYFGPVSAGRIYGRAYKRYWPIARAAAFSRPDFR